MTLVVTHRPALGVDGIERFVRLEIFVLEIQESLVREHHSRIGGHIVRLKFGGPRRGTHVGRNASLAIVYSSRCQGLEVTAGQWMSKSVFKYETLALARKKWNYFTRLSFLTANLMQSGSRVPMGR